MRKYFGTDGVRGVANTELTPELAFKLGRAGGYVLAKNKKEAKVVIGKDTRISGDMLEYALIAGLLSVGIEVVRLGVLPTPGVSYITRKLLADAGVMISASHNPVQDNGIKFFGGDGYKLSDELEKEIEHYLENQDDLPRPQGAFVGKVKELHEATSLYSHFLKQTIDVDLTGVKIVIDSANGAASFLASTLFSELNAEVIPIHHQPTGLNINEKCGSTHPEELQAKVLSEKAHIGVAFDGDADRIIAVDEKGELVDGDDLLFIFGTFLKQHAALRENTVVSTVMSNYGFIKALEERGITSKQTAVGDRYVIEEMKKEGYILGGEQSGHLIFLEHNTTGDGVLSALQLVQVLVKSKQPLSVLRSQYQKYPQKLVNVKVKDKYSWKDNAFIQQSIEEMEKRLNGKGRILIRPSGTESLIRVMAESESESETIHIVETLVHIIEEEERKKA